jgi:hypothetical protein
MKIGLSVKIDVKKIKKERLYVGEKGTYLDLTTFIDTEEKDQYGNNGFISQSADKEEKEQGVQTPILGNCKIFYTKESNNSQEPNGNYSKDYKNIPPQNHGDSQANNPVQDDEIPF